MAERRGKFVVLEGVDGSGKSTQVSLLVERLRRERVGVGVVQTREPGGSDLAEAVRGLVLGWQGPGLGARAEALLFAAARADHVEEVVGPALEAGEWVVCDRFVDSTAAYQGVGRGLGVVDVLGLSAWACAGAGVSADLVVVLDVPVDVGAARRGGEGGAEDRIEAAGLEFQERVREYLLRRGRGGDGVVVVSGVGSVEDVAQRVWECVSVLL